jgi:hypothetical protein
MTYLNCCLGAIPGNDCIGVSESTLITVQPYIKLYNILQRNLSKPNLFGTKICVRNRQVCGYRLN